MSSPTGQPPGISPWQASQAQAPPTAPSNDENEDGVSVRPMRLKVLYTFDDQNKTNCLARWPHVLHIQTIAMDETTSIGVIELKTCIDAIIQCSPELVARLGQDYTVYAYDYSEYDNPLVGQGMLSRALTAASPTPDAPASESRQLITGRVCKNILGIFTNGVKETLEVKLRLVPVPTMLQGEYTNTMGKYREMSKGMNSGMDGQEWNSFLQSNPNLGQTAKGLSPAPGMNNMSNSLRDGMSMEVMNQLLSPYLQQQHSQDPFNQVSLIPPTNQTPMNAENSGNESRGTTIAGEKAKKPPRPSSRASVKRPRGRKPKATGASAIGGNTSGYEEGTDGDDGPSNKKRVKVTKTDWNGNTTLGMTPDSLRVVAGTSGSLRLFRPIAAHPNAGPGTNHLQDIPRAPTPVPHLPNQHIQRDQAHPQSSLRRDSFAQLTQMPQSMSSYPTIQQSEDQVRTSIESAHPSPERNFSPIDTPPDISSSPPVMRTRPPSTMRSSPPCPSSPVLPQMPRTDSGFMSGSLEELFGEDDPMEPANDYNNGFAAREQVKEPAPARQGNPPHGGSDFDLIIQEETPGNMELLPTRMPVIDLPTQGRARAKLNRACSIASGDGLSLPPLKKSKQPAIRRTMSQSDIRPTEYNPQKSSLGPQAPKIVAQAEQELQQHSQCQPPPEIRQPNQVRQPSQTRMSQPLLTASNQAPSSAPGIAAALPVSTPAFLPPTAQTPFQEATPPLPVPIPAPAPAPSSRPSSRSGMMARTASMGSLTLPHIPASDPVLPPSNLQRSQTWSEAPPHLVSEAHMPGMQVQPQLQMTHQMPPAIDYRRPAPVPYSRTLNAKKASIKQKLELAIANGEMPPFCANCGAIDTPTWRKAWSQDLQGVPGYYEYSDDPGCVTTIIILTRDAEGKPTSHKLIKKFLGPEEDQKDFDEFLLCNPCGIWMSKYRTQRPADKWGNSGPQERARGEQKKRSTQRLSRPRKPPTSTAMMPTSEATFMQSDAHFPASDANFPVSEALGPPADGISPGDTSCIQQTAGSTEHLQRQRSTSARPKRHLNAMTSDAASAALRRAIQSSPARWVGTQHSPIELEEEVTPDPTRRLLFPSPRKDASPKVLGEVVANVVQIATEFPSLKESMVAIEGQNKENMPPAIEGDDEDAAFLHLFEEEMSKADEIQRPSTPIQKPPTQNPFKTPTRPTPSHRPITRSVTRSVRSARSNRSAKSPSELLTFTRTTVRTPGSAVRRMLSPRIVDGVFESPFTATLNQMMSDANNQTSPTRDNGMGMELDFGNLPELPQLGQDNRDMNFNMEDFFSTDVPMPSSPPRMGNYQIYEDPATTMSKMNNLDWSEFGKFATEHIAAEKEIVIKEEPANSPVKLAGKEKDVAQKSAGVVRS
ncbi:uncharacterized protein RAG0_05041 [Rhynchosporium agropyri]|uniref:Ams2/SPT21 N-terminal domain-containing protein n=1 Tax=Rhynchosporium agropyri TaxID=914238 RepID=A0A1E1KBJ1_9HELO|nr:uncharacterized protein RAG0_05041 [Rhynchosporium agropyri]